jgi:hypothetical protein
MLHSIILLPMSQFVKEQSREGDCHPKPLKSAHLIQGSFEPHANNYRDDKSATQFPFGTHCNQNNSYL